MTPTLQTDTDNTTHAPQASSFSWYELHTPDAAAAAAFYAPVLGWNVRDSGMQDKKYTLVSVGETPVGGLLEKPPAAFAAGEHARWLGYLGVSDVDAHCRRVWQAGGKVLRAAEEIPGVGAFAVVADTQGAVFVLFQPAAGVAPPERPGISTPGMPVWHDLGTADPEAAFRFYSDLFGWTKLHAMPMGPDGVYQIFAIDSQPAGGIATAPDPTNTGWLFYFHVSEIEAAIDRVKQHGGTVVHGPSEVPGGQFIAHCFDPQGAIFGIVGPRKS